MCTISLTYDQNNALARRKLDELLKSGLFKRTETVADRELRELERRMDAYEREGLVLFCEQEDSLVATDPFGDGEKRWRGEAMEFMAADDYPDFFLARRAVPEATWAEYAEALRQLGHMARFGQLGGYPHPESEEAFERLANLDSMEVLLSDNEEFAYLIRPDDLRLRSFANAHYRWI